MKSLKTILETVMTDLSNTIPGQLATAGLSDFIDYELGPPRDSKVSTCSIMYDPGIPFDNTFTRLPILIFAQLCSIDYGESLQYADLLLAFIKAFDSQKIGMTLLNSIDIDIIPIDRERSTLIYITANFEEPLDSCDD